MANRLLPLISPESNRAENNVERSRDCETYLLCKPFQQKSWFKLNTTHQLCFLDWQVLDRFFVFVGIRQRRLNESFELSPYMVGGLNSAQWVTNHNRYVKHLLYLKTAFLCRLFYTTEHLRSFNRQGKNCSQILCTVVVIQFIYTMKAQKYTYHYLHLEYCYTCFVSY